MSNYLRKIGLGIGALILPYVIGCGPSKQNFIEGEVIKEEGTLAQLDKSSGALFGNESVKLGGSYVLIIKATDGITYTLKINDTYAKPVAALAQAIEEGDTVRFIKQNYSGGINGVARIDSNDHVGQISSTLVTIVRKAEKKK